MSKRSLTEKMICLPIPDMAGFSGPEVMVTFGKHKDTGMSMIAATFPLPREGGLSLLERVKGFFLMTQAAMAAREKARKELALAYARQSAEALEATTPGSIVRLNAQTFDIASCTLCALAQIYGHYNTAPNHLREGKIRYGFMVPTGLAERYMNEAWQIIIREAKAA